MKIIFVLLMLATISFNTLAGIPEKNEQQPDQTSIDGFNDTPMQPDGKWHIHDPNRPQPEVATPQYDGQPVPAPADAKILFDGSNLDNFSNNDWKVENGVMITGKGNQISKASFGDIHLHAEWLIPEGLPGWGQKQGNSGIFMMGRYEIQVLNCWANRTYPDGMTGALYGQNPPLVNACRKPGEWQSYDIYFKAPVFENDKLISPATVTIYLNNVLVQDKSAYRGASTWKKTPEYKPHPSEQPFFLQSHGNPVHYRNIWVAPFDKN